MTKPNRPKVPVNIETNVLTKSGRRCALCFGLEGDGRIKPGQIAHLDKNRENNKEENLAFLCLIHHDQYDTKTSQSKGFTQSELKKYREKLYQAIEKEFLPRNNLASVGQQLNEIVEHDKKIFQKADEILSEQIIRNFLQQLINDDSCYTLDMRRVRNFIHYFDEITNYFLCESLNSLREELIILLDSLNTFISYKFFIYPKKQSGENQQLCLQPNLNIDREGCPRDIDIFIKYEELQKELRGYCNQVFEKYKEYRLEIKKMLII